MPDTPILLATSNPDKQQELRRIFRELPFAPFTPEQAGLNVSVEESGETHEAIAMEKAVGWSAASSTLAIASDGGLVIPVLGPRWESRHTRRFAGPAADNDGRLAQLLDLMRPYRCDDRRATWMEALALADRGRLLASWEIAGGIGYLDEQPPEGPLPEFWVFSVWRFRQFGTTYDRMTAAQHEAVGDHWAHLGRLARRYLTSTYVPPIRG